MRSKSILIIALAFFIGAFLLFKGTKKSEPLESELLESSQGDRDNPYAALKFRYEMVAGIKRNIDPQSRLNAIEYTKNKLQSDHKLMKTNGITAWNSIGPGNIGGRIRSIIVSPSNTANLLVGAVAGGVWKSTDGGASWTSKLDNGAQLAISCMIKDPSNENIIYAGTGEGWGNVDGVYGGGIYKSTDFGETWALLSSTIGTNVWNFRNVRSMAFDPSGNLYAVTWAYNNKDNRGSYKTTGGLYKSTDGGISWTAIHSKTFITNYFNGCDVVPFSSSTIIFATEPNGATLGGIYRTTNSGTNWNKITTNLPTTNYNRIAFAKDPNNANTAYAQIESSNYGPPDYGLAGIFKTTDAGATWSTLTKPGNISSSGNSKTGSLSFLGEQGWYDNVIAVDPFNSNNLYVGGIDMMKSTNGGASWFQLTYWDPSYGTPVIHCDHHAIVFDPVIPNVVYSGDDGGIQKTTNGGTSWTNLNNNLVITQFYGGAVFPTGNTYYGGSQDNGHLKFGLGTSWNEVEGGDGGYAAQDQSNSSVAFEEYLYLEMYKTINNGSTWNSCTTGLTDAGIDTACLFISPFSMNPQNSSVLIAGSNKVWVTINSAQSWAMVSNGLSTAGLVSAVTIARSSSPYLGLAGTTDGHVFICTSLSPKLGINTWTDITPLGNNGAYVRRISIDPANQQNIYVCYSGYNNDNVTPTKHVWFSSTQGSSWNDVSGDLPDVPVHSLLVDKSNSSILYIGTETGVYQSINGGTNWTSAASGMPAFVPVDELVYQSGTNYIFAFTHGRSAFITSAPTHVDLADFNTPVSFEISQNYPNPFNPSTSIKYSIPSDANVSLTVYNIKGEVVKKLVDTFQKAGNYTTIIDGAGLASGIYFYRIDAGKFSQTKKMVLLK
jgi:photosystem II stability/assembly factor-like uncharacterized protein